MLNIISKMLKKLIESEKLYRVLRKKIIEINLNDDVAGTHI